MIITTTFGYGHTKTKLSMYSQICSILQYSRGITLKKCFFFGVKTLESQRGLSIVNTALLKPEVVLSEKNRRECVKRLQLYKMPKPVKKSANEAAILVPLCMYKGQLGLLYTLRSTKLNVNRGQVSFPGGKRDQQDKDMFETALRETWEELAIPQDSVDVWGSGNEMGRENVTVTPVLGYIGNVDPESLQINRDEVEEAFVVPLQTLCDPTFTRFTQFRNNYTLPLFLGGKHRIWGLTAAATHTILRALIPGVYNHKLVFLPTIGNSDKKLLASTTTTS